MSICFPVNVALAAHFTRRKGGGCGQQKAEKLIPLKWEKEEGAQVHSFQLGVSPTAVCARWTQS